MNAPAVFPAGTGVRAADPTRLFRGGGATMADVAVREAAAAQAATARLTPAQQSWLREHRRDFVEALGLDLHALCPARIFASGTRRGGAAADAATARLTGEQRRFLAAHKMAFRAHLHALGDPRHRLYCGRPSCLGWSA